ncbi:MAG: hypothetical protein K9N51_12680, partial [Candidatus Pacebacteria bacterium]|nr:hypothetical protein [Candidatus Paceibacterota bacterium]
LASWAVAAKNTLRTTLPSEGKRPCWHSVFLQRLAGIGSRDEWIRAIDNPNALRPRTAYMWYWAVEAMLRDRLYPRAMNTMRRIWGPLIHQGFDTCPEHLFENSDAYRQPGSALSYCHGWAAGPNALFAHHILGVHPRHPADPHWTPHPNTAGLRWIEGKVPSPKAEVSVRRRGNPEVGY